MDKTSMVARMSRMVQTPSREERALLAGDVAHGRYFFRELGPRGRGPVEVAFGGRELCSENYRVQRATYPFFTLEYVAQGEGRISFDDGDWQPLRAGTLFAHGPGLPLRMEAAAGGTLVKYFVCLNGAGARRTLERHAPVLGKPVTLARHTEVGDIFDLLVREGGEHTPFTREICNHVVRLLLLKIGVARRQRLGERHDSARERFSRCKTLIDEHGAKFSTLEDIARTLHVDPSALNRLFRRYQGVSPYQYLLRWKMNRAAQDLIRSGGFVKEVAARSGYPDPYHFSRLFKAVHGISPAHFLRHYAPGE